MSALLDALRPVVDLLGPPDAAEPGDDGVVRWGRRGGISLAVHDCGPPGAVLVAERLDGTARSWTFIGDGTVRDACAWLGWSVPRPALAGAVGVDANGAPVP